MLLISEIEDDVAVFPSVIVNWKINDEWTLRNSRADFGLGHGGGIEAAWAFAENWEVAFGAQFQWRQFKLDDDGVAPDGVGEELSIPVYANLTWDFNQMSSLHLMAGVVGGGELELQNSRGDRISDEDFDPTVILGARVTIKF